MTANSAILRELAAQPRTFRDVKHAVLWYRDQLALRLRTGRDVSDVGTPRSRESIDIADATFAAIAQCLRRTHPADIDEAASWLASSERVYWLVESYSTEHGSQFLAEKAKCYSEHEFFHLCHRTEQILSRRMRETGVIRA